MFILRSDGRWNHCPLRKTFFNPILRIIQFWTNRPYVIATVCTMNEHRRPVFVKYELARVQYYKSIDT